MTKEPKPIDALSMTEREYQAAKRGLNQNEMARYRKRVYDRFMAALVASDGKTKGP